MRCEIDIGLMPKNRNEWEAYCMAEARDAERRTGEAVTEILVGKFICPWPQWRPDHWVMPDPIFRMVMDRAP